MFVCTLALLRILIMLIVMWYPCKHALFYLVDHGNLIGMLCTMVGQISLLCFIRIKIFALLPMSPEQIVKDNLARASKAKQEKNKSENEIAAKEFEQQHKTNSKSSSAVSNEIKLTSPTLFATKVDISDLDVSQSVCFVFVCKDALFSFEELPPSLPPVVTNLLQEFIDVFPQDVPPGLPPIRGIEHQIDLIPGASLPNRAPYRT